MFLIPNSYLGHLLSWTDSENRKWRFQHLRRRVWPGDRENRARCSQIPTSLFSRRIQRRWPFLHDSIFFFRYTAISSKSVSGVIYPKNRSFFRMKLRHIFETGVAICFLISNSYPEETANAVGCVSQKSQWEFENSGPDSSGPRVKHACEGSETSIFCFQDQFITRDGLIAKNDPQFLET